MNLTCHSCAAEQAVTLPLGRRDTCEGCGADLRCCRQCRLYDESAPQACREPQAEAPREKERANFCEHFVPGSPEPRQAGGAEAARAAFDALFKK